MIDIKADTHTHTVASTHAYSTVEEMAKRASECGMEAIALTDHGMMLPDAPHDWHFHNLKNIPREIHGVKILYGIEANILNRRGDIDPLAEEIYEKLDIVNASIHVPCYEEERGGDHTETYLNVVNNPIVDVICHSGTAAFPYDYEKIVKLAKKNNKLIEINNHSFYVRQSSVPNCRRLAELCAEYGTGIVVSSDAHIIFDLGEYGKALEMLEEIGFPEELIINRSFDSLAEFFERKGKPFFRWKMGYK